MHVHTRIDFGSLPDVGGGNAEFVPVRITDGSFNARAIRYHFRWRPVRGHEGSKPYRLCVRTVDAYGSDSQTRCFTIVVKKCQYCLQPGESINSIAMSLGTDWLQLYTMNPFLGTPDDLAPYTRVNTGVFYDVRKVCAHNKDRTGQGHDCLEDSGALCHPIFSCTCLPKVKLIKA